MGGVRTFKIDAFAESAFRSRDHDAIVCIDVILASTTAVTCLAQGRQVFFARTAEEARARAGRLFDPVLVNELGDESLPGSEKLAGPADCARLSDARGPLVLLTSMAHLLANSESASGVYVACLRNLLATSRLLAAQHQRVAIIGAGFGGELRCEDQLAAAWIGSFLADCGFEPEDLTTAQEVERWAQADVSMLSLGKAADYLRRFGQQRDLDFVLSHVNDLDLVCRYAQGELRMTERARRHAPVAVLGVAPSPALVAAPRYADGKPGRAAVALLQHRTLGDATTKAPN